MDEPILNFPTEETKAHVEDLMKTDLQAFYKNRWLPLFKRLVAACDDTELVPPPSVIQLNYQLYNFLNQK